jgi:crotonobetainyl-CoA:carnitine CoA-transferase CaiB-like acyl-CoA transferase
MSASRGGVSCLFQNTNRGKRSLALDLKQPEGVEIIHRLVADVDVVTHNFRAGVAERLGIDYATLSAINPDLIYLWVNGFGAEGPMHRKAAFDNVIQAFAGVAQSQCDMETGEPTQYYQIFSDKVTAMTGAQAISAALFARSQGRGGQEIKLAMVDSVVSFLWCDVASVDTFLDEGATLGMSVARNKLCQFSDGWGAMAPVTDAQFHGACAAFGVDTSAPELATVLDRNQHKDKLEEAFDAVRAAMLEVSVEEGMRRLDAADVPCAPAMNLGQLPQHPQLQANQTFTETQHPQAGRVVEPVNPPNFSATPSGAGRPSAALGQHTQEVLVELGYAESDIESLRTAGVVG